jgi:hypothetical protein
MTSIQCVKKRKMSAVALEFKASIEDDGDGEIRPIMEAMSS